MRCLEPKELGIALRTPMAPKPNIVAEISRDRLAELLDEDLAREYQAIIAYVVYSPGCSKAPNTWSIADQLELHAKQESLTTR